MIIKFYSVIIRIVSNYFYSTRGKGEFDRELERRAARGGRGKQQKRRGKQVFNREREKTRL